MIAVSILGIVAVACLIPKIVGTFFRMTDGSDLGTLLPSIFVTFTLMAEPFYGLVQGMNAGIDAERVERLADYREIAANPGKWLAGQLKTVPDPSVGGVLLVIDRKIGEIRSDSGDADNAGEIMEYGRAIDALEGQKECVRRLKSPVRCADGESSGVRHAR